MANCNPPVKGQAFDLSASLYTTAGALIANVGTLTDKISKDYGNWGDPHGTGATDEDTTYGQVKIALDATDMDADVIDVYLIDDTANCVAYKATIYTTPATGIPANLISILGTALTETAGQIAAAFKKFFNVATPTGTVNSLPAAAADAAGGLPVSDAGGLDMDTYIKRLEAAFTSTIAGRIDENISAAKTLADDAITAAKFDESTAYPLKSADTGATAVARTGADSDTLETLSDQIDDVPNNTEFTARTLAAADYVVVTDTIAGATTVGSVTTKTGYELTAAYDAAKTAGTSTLTAQQVWEYATRTLSAFGFSVTVGTNNDKTGYTLTATPPTAVQIRQDMDANSTKLANLDAAISTRLATAGYTAPASAATIATAVWSAVARTLTAFDFDVTATIDEEALAAAIVAALEGADLVDEEAVAAAVVAALAGQGSVSWTYTLTEPDMTTPIADAQVWATTDAAGANVVASGRTNAFGTVTFALDPGTYYIWAKKTGYDFASPDVETVSP